MRLKAWFIEKCVPFLGAGLLRLVYSTLRWHRLSELESQEEAGWNQPRVLAFWHGEQLMLPFVFNREVGRNRLPVYVLISQHRDGRLIARAIRHMGIDSVAGSSSSRGKEALAELIAKYKEGNFVAITPDGPRGPLHQSKPGIVRLAQETGSAIFPLAIHAERIWQFKSWDRMFLPKPFSRAVFVVGKPIAIPEELSFEDSLALVDKELCRVSTRAQDFNYDENRESLWR